MLAGWPAVGLAHGVRLTERYDPRRRVSAKTWFASRHARELGTETDSRRKDRSWIDEVTTRRRLGSHPADAEA